MGSITQLPGHARSGDAGAQQELFKQLYDDLDPLARMHLARNADDAHRHASVGSRGAMRGGEPRARSVVADKCVIRRLVPTPDTKWPNVSMGLGWQLEKRGDAWLPFHPGGDPGFRSLLVLYPEQRRAIAILSNGENTPRFEIRDAIEALLAR